MARVIALAASHAPETAPLELLRSAIVLACGLALICAGRGLPF